MALTPSTVRHFLDWGSTELRWTDSARSVVFCEPNYTLERRAAGAETDKTVLAVGTAAARFVGRVPAAAELLQPFLAGLPVDLGVAGRAGLAVLSQLGWLEPWWQQWLHSRKLVWAVPTQTTTVEREWLRDLAQTWGYRQVELVSQSLAIAAFWTHGQATETPLWVMDLGATKTELGIVQGGALVTGQTVRFGLNSLVESVQTAVAANHQVELSAAVATQVLQAIGTVGPVDETPSNQRELAVMGRSLLTQLPTVVTIKASGLQPYLVTALQPLQTELNSFMATLPTTAFSEAMHHGVALSGGGARLHGLDHWLKTTYKLTCQQTKQPERVVLEGLMQV